MSDKLWIMIAGPYTSGAATQEQRAENLKQLNEAAYEVFKKGHIPIIGVNLALPIIEATGPESYDEIMMPLSLATAKRCDGVLRVGGASAGADQEVELIRSRGGDVFHDISQVPDVNCLS